MISSSNDSRKRRAGRPLTLGPGRQGPAGDLAQLGPVVDAWRVGSARSATRSGWCSSPAATRRLLPRTRHSRWPPSSASRNIRASVSARCGPAASVRSPSRPPSGSGDSREPSEQQGKELLHQPGGSGQAPGQLGQRLPRPLGLLEAEGRQPFVDGGVAHAGGHGPDAAERLEQGTEEDPLVEGVAPRPGGAAVHRGTGRPCPSEPAQRRQTLE